MAFCTHQRGPQRIKVAFFFDCSPLFTLFLHVKRKKDGKAKLNQDPEISGKWPSNILTQPSLALSSRHGQFCQALQPRFGISFDLYLLVFIFIPESLLVVLVAE